MTRRQWSVSGARGGRALLLLGLVLTASGASAQSLTGWSYRRIVTVTHPSPPLSGHQVRLELSSANFDFSKAQADGRDLRITTGETDAPLPFWVERWGGGQATVWVKVPSIPVGGTALRLYYGHGSASSASSGSATFEFFEDFQTPGATRGYFQLGPPQQIMAQAGWETEAPHTLSVVEANRGGYRYWGYYGLQGCGGIGIVRSNDLATWTRIPGPLLNTEGERWPTVLLINGTFYMVHTRDYCGTSHLVLRTSTDGLTFTAPSFIVAPEAGARNQNPALFRDPKTGSYFLYWYRGAGGRWEIRVRQAASIPGLATAPSKVLISAPIVVAAPQVLYHQGTYFLSVETYEDGIWHTRIHTSDVPDAGFRELPGNPVLGDGAACFFQHVFDNTLHAYYCKETAGVWTLDYRKADLAAGRLLTAAPAAERWAAEGGAWQTVAAAQPNGLTGAVGQGTTVGRQTLHASFTGTDYVVEASGRQVQGRVWGLGVRASDSHSLLSLNLYEDLDATNNLYAYAWAGGSATEVTKTAVGPIHPNDWHRLTAKVRGAVVEVYLDGQFRFQVTDPRASAGTGIALYGEKGTRAQFDNVFVRKYAATEPSVSVGPETAL